MIMLDSFLCDICGTCAGVCPKDAILIEKDAVRIDSEICVECGACETVCPSGAIKIEQ